SPYPEGQVPDRPGFGLLEIDSVPDVIYGLLVDLGSFIEIEREIVRLGDVECAFPVYVYRKLVPVFPVPFYRRYLQYRPPHGSSVNQSHSLSLSSALPVSAVRMAVFLAKAC